MKTSSLVAILLLLLSEGLLAQNWCNNIFSNNNSSYVEIFSLFSAKYNSAVKSKISIEQVQELNPKLSRAQIDYMLWHSPDLLNHFKQTPYLDFLPRQYAEQHGVVDINLNEIELLELSNINISPREMGRLIVYSDYDSLMSAPILGEYARIYFDEYYLANKAFELSHKLKYKLQRVEVTHTHPAWEILIDDNWHLTYPLSKSDITFIKKLSLIMTDIPVTMRAVVANGWAHQKTYRNGVLIDDWD